jgi:uncharacterized membrane protein YphA (DoxX/SURF4 family)
MRQKISDFFASTPVQWACQIILGGVFIYAGITKITHLHGFAKIMYNYQLLPDTLIYIPTAILPWVEILSGFFLMTGVFKRTAALLLSFLLLTFIVAISFNLIRGLNFDCGCFSPDSTENGSNPIGLLIRDLLLLIPGAAVIFKNKW